MKTPEKDLWYAKCYGFMLTEMLSRATFHSFWILFARLTSEKLYICDINQLKNSNKIFLFIIKILSFSGYFSWHSKRAPYWEYLVLRKKHFQFGKGNCFFCVYFAHHISRTKEFLINQLQISVNRISGV